MKLFFRFFFKIDDITLDPYPDLDPNSKLGQSSGSRSEFNVFGSTTLLITIPMYQQHIPGTGTVLPIRYISDNKKAVRTFSYDSEANCPVSNCTPFSRYVPHNSPGCIEFYKLFSSSNISL